MRGTWMTLRRRGLTTALGLAALIAGAQPSRATMPPLHGPMPPEMTAALRAGLMDLPARAEPGAPGAAGARSALAGQTLWRVPVILVSYSDSTLITTAQDFDQLLFDTTASTPTGSVFDYYQWASAGRMRVIPTVVATVTMANTRNYYSANSRGVNGYITPRNDAGLVMDALKICHRNVDWTRFDVDHDNYVDMLWVVHAGKGGEGTSDLNDAWSITSALSGYLSSWFNSQPVDVSAPGAPPLWVNRFSILPELSLFK